jgi:aryl-alcohol dehydrogenase-like predicted oxidoreductase
MTNLAIGTVQFGLEYGIANKTGKINISEGKKIINSLVENGILTLDTAIGYGESENILGEIGVDEFEVITKIPSVKDEVNIEEKIEGYIKQSLTKLRVDSLYSVLMHSSDDLFTVNGKLAYNHLIKMKNRNLIEKVGVSIYDPNDLKKIISNYDVDIVQGPLNVFDQRLLTSGLLDELRNNSIEFHARSAFLQGLLLMNKNERHSYFERWNDEFLKFENWCKKNKLTVLEACIAFLNSTKRVDKIVVGVDSYEQLSEILKIRDKLVNELPFELQQTDQALINPAQWKVK